MDGCSAPVDRLQDCQTSVSSVAPWEIKMCGIRGLQTKRCREIMSTGLTPGARDWSRGLLRVDLTRVRRRAGYDVTPVTSTRGVRASANAFPRRVATTGVAAYHASMLTRVRPVWPRLDASRRHLRRRNHAAASRASRPALTSAAPIHLDHLSPQRSKKQAVPCCRCLVRCRGLSRLRTSARPR